VSQHRQGATGECSGENIYDEASYHSDNNFWNGTIAALTVDSGVSPMARTSFELDGKSAKKGSSKASTSDGSEKKKFVLIGIVVLCLAAAAGVTFFTNRPVPVAQEDLAPPPVELTPEQEKEQKRVLEIQERMNAKRPPVGS
jgi:hypothetical protein